MLIDAHNDVSLSARRVITDVRRSHDLVQFLPIEAIVASGIWTKTRQIEAEVVQMQCQNAARLVFHARPQRAG